MRQQIKGNENFLDFITIMAEGNPGAIRVLSELASSSIAGLMHILALDDMNIRGSQIWIGYKDFAKQNMETFIAGIASRSKKMVDVINNERTGNDEVAVQNGASLKR